MKRQRHASVSVGADPCVRPTPHRVTRKTRASHGADTASIVVSLQRGADTGVRPYRGLAIRSRSR
jgi:hypothetical protein